MKRGLIFCVAALVLVGTAACGSDDSEPTTLARDTVRSLTSFALLPSFADDPRQGPGNFFTITTFAAPAYLVGPDFTVAYDKVGTATEVDGFLAEQAGYPHGMRAAHGDELLAVERTTISAVPSSATKVAQPSTATVEVNGTARPVPEWNGSPFGAPDAALLLDVPVGSTVRLVVTDRGHPQSLDLRTGQHVDVSTAYYPLRQGHNERQMLVDVCSGRTDQGGVNIYSVYSELDGYAPDHGWAEPDRGWLQLALTMDYIGPAPDDKPTAITLDLARTITVTAAGVTWTPPAGTTLTIPAELRTETGPRDVLWTGYADVPVGMTSYAITLNPHGTVTGTAVGSCPDRTPDSQTVQLTVNRGAPELTTQSPSTATS